MSIQLPLKIEKTEGAKFCHLTDSTGRAICGGLVQEDAEEIVNALNSNLMLNEDKEHRNEGLLI